MASKVASTFLIRVSRINAFTRSNRSINTGIICGVTNPIINGFKRHINTEKPNVETDKHKTSIPNDVTEDEKKSNELEALTNEIRLLKEQNENLLDKYKRSLAESENLRVRLTKQIEDAKIYGIQGFCKDLLEIADTLGHATDSVPKEEINNNNPHLKNLFEGLTMTRASLLQVFKRHGLEPVNPIKEKFNPNIHEALYQKEDKTVEPNTIIEVTKLGYKLHERCIRPALVGVSKSSCKIRVDFV